MEVLRMVLGPRKTAWKALAIRSLVGKSGAIFFKYFLSFTPIITCVLSSLKLSHNYLLKMFYPLKKFFSLCVSFLVVSTDVSMFTNLCHGAHPV